MYDSLFSVMIMLSPLIYRMLIYLFLLLSIIIVSYDLFGTMCLISRMFYHLGWPKPLRFFTALTKPFCSFAIQGFCIIIYLDDILVLVCSKWVGKRAHCFLCFLLVQLVLYINFMKSDFLPHSDLLCVGVML